jgi:uncharacterized protein (TIGR02646 family)
MILVQHPTVWPKSLENRRNNPGDNGIPLNPMNSWNSFRGKQELRSHLLRTQEGLCPYCELKLDTELGNHIEHIQPKTANPHLTFEYTNLILSCFSSNELRNYGSSARSCGHYKDSAVHHLPLDFKRFISPTDPNCEHYFQYELNGEIDVNLHYIHDVTICNKVKYTIERLNLNCNRLVRQREEVINDGFNIIHEFGDDQQALNMFIELEFQITNQRYLFPFINLRKQFFEWYKI